MDITLSNIITWLIVGALVGDLVGRVVKRKKEGFGWFKNTLIGLVGALIGGVIWKVLKLDLNLSNVSVSLEDVVAASIGAVLFLIGVRIFKKKKGTA